MKRFALLPLLLALACNAAAQDTNDYVLRSDLAAYAERADLDSYATHETLSNYSLTSDLTAYATLADLAGLASLSDLSAYPTLSSLGAEIASYLASNPPSATALTNYALRSDLTAYATLSALAGYVSADSLTNYPTRSELSAYATAADLDGLATSDDLSGYALLSALPAEIASYLATNPPTVSSAILTNYALRSDLSAYATASDLDGFATDEDIADFATLSNLYSAVSSALSSVSNSFLGAYSSTSGSNTYWHVPVLTDFEETTSILGELYVENIATFADDMVAESGSIFNGPAAFEDSVTFGGETRTNFPGPRERIVYGGEDAWITADDGLVWTTPDESDVWIYLGAVTNAAGRAVTVVIRNLTSDDDSVVTRIYDGTSGTPQLFHTLTPTNPIAVFDWCSSCDAWIAR